MAADNIYDKKQLAAELVVKAIADLNEEKGSTLRRIQDYIGNEYKIPTNVIKGFIIPSLQNGVQFGVISHTMGRYQLSSLMDNIVDLACKSSCRPKRKCNRSSKNFRRIDYKSADVCYEDKDHTGASPRACGGKCEGPCSTCS